jgi:hypothetical protein
VGDRERQNRTFIRKLVLLRDTEGQGETPGYGQIAVKPVGLRAAALRAGSRKRLRVRPRVALLSMLRRSRLVLKGCRFKVMFSVDAALLPR